MYPLRRAALDPKQKYTTDRYQVVPSTPNDTSAIGCLLSTACYAYPLRAAGIPASPNQFVFL